jgi:hypothetical protein
MGCETPIPEVTHVLKSIAQALIHSRNTHKNHLPSHRAVDLSTYGILYFGTPHQGTKTASYGKILLAIQSLYKSTGSALLRHIERDTEGLERQLGQYLSVGQS